MATENTRILQQFSETFPKAVNSLTTILGRFLDQMQSAAETVGQAAQGGGGGGGGGNIRIGGGGHDDVGGNYPRTIADRRHPDYPYAYIARGNVSHPNPFYNTNDRGDEFLTMPRFGQMTIQDRMKQLSMFLSNRAGVQRDSQGNPILGEGGMPTYSRPALMKGSSVIGHLAEQAGFAQGQVISAKNAITMVRNHMTGMTAPGQQGGYSRGGLLGTSFLSPAYRAGMVMKTQSIMDSWGGLNPNFTSSQASDAMKTAAAYGYVGAQGADVQHLLKNMMINTGLPGSSIMGMIDPGVRYGTNSLADLTQQITNLALVARSSGIAVDALASQVSSAGGALQAVTGGTTYNSTYAAQAYTTATGLPATFLSGMAKSPLNLQLAYMHAGSPWAFMTESGGRQALNLMAGQQSMLGGMGLGTLAQQRAKLTNRNPAVREQFKQQLAKLQYAGLIPSWSNYALQVMHAPQEASRLQAMNMITSDLGVLSNHGRLSSHSVEAVAQKMHVSMSQVGGGSKSQQLNKLMQILSAKGQQQTQRNRQQTVIALDPWARKLLHIQNPDTVSNRSSSTGAEVASYASQFAGGFLGGATTGAEVGGMVGLAGGPLDPISVPVGILAGAAIGGTISGLGSIL